MTAALDESGARLRRIQHVLAALILLGFIVLAWRVRPEVGIGTNDELEYRALSQSLAQGEYREIFSVGSAHAHKYPPGFPAFLLTLRVVAGDHFDVVRAANLALFAGALLMVYLIGSTVVNGWAALITIALVAVSPYTLRYAASMMSEPLYLFLSIAALAMTRAVPRYGRRAVAAASAFALLAFLTRSAGITIVAAIGVWLLTRRSATEIVSFSLAAAIVVGGWFVYSSSVSQPGVATGSYEMELVVGTRQTIGDYALAQRVRTVVDRLGWVPSTMDLPRTEGTAVDNVVTLVGIGALLVAGVIALWGTWPAAAAYTTLYIALMAGWPFPSSRLHLPILPLTILVSTFGAIRIGQRLPTAARVPLAAMLVMLAAFNPVRSAWASDVLFRECDRANAYESHGCYTWDERALAKISRVLGARSAAGDVVAVHTKPASVFFMTERQTALVVPLLRIPPDAIADTLRARSIRFVLITRYMPIYGIEGMARTLSAACHDFNIEANVPPAGFLISVTPAGDTSGNSCAALEAFAKLRSPTVK